MTTATPGERKALLPAVHLKPGASQRRALARDLKTRVRGDVRFDGGGRALYATDLSAYRQVPIGVVVPRDVEDLLRTVETCRRFEAPILCRGGGTSLGGQTCNVAVVIDFSRYMRGIIALDPDRKQARVEPGVVCDQLRDAAEEYHLTWGPDPATHRYCTLGGMIANNSCGTHSIVAGRSSDNVERLKVLTYDGHVLDVGPTSDEDLVRIINEGGRKGEIYGGLKAVRDRYGELVRQRYPRIPRRVSGFNIDDLLPENGFNVARALSGTEGTCAITLEATTRLIDSPPARVLLVLGYPDQYQAADHVWQLRSYGPRTIECVDTSQIVNMRRLNLHQNAVKLLPEGGAWLLLTYGGANPEEARDRARSAMQEIERNCRPASMRLYEDPFEQQQVWLVRESAIGASRIPSEFETWSSWEDAAVHPEKMGPYLRDFKKLLDQFGYTCVFFGHYGDGCVHSRIDFDFKTAAGVKKFRAWMEAASDLVLAYGGSLSGEHGDGQSHAELHPKMFGDELVQGFREFKRIWDPERKMNPGKVVDPYPFDSNLRFGPDYNPRQPKTVFRFPDDRGSFANATARCFGVGLCRKAAGGTMCPSYMVTRDEMHTTRGRAHLLFEMLQGEAITKGWRDKHVKESLDLCLACKGCKGECPVKVDVATYKAEFLSHYYAGRLRPAAAYATGLIMWWARVAGVAPRLANRLTHVRPFAQLSKAAIGLAPEREVPPFARTAFKRWFRQREPRNPGGTSVLLWPDTFNNYFHPETAIAAVELLEAAGFQVHLPAQALCCGRPLYDHGMLELAKRMLRDVLNALSPQIRAGVPLVALEPSCAAVFRDELVNLFPNDQDARRLAQQTLSLAEFLQRHAPGFEWPELSGRRALFQGHCHQKAVWGTSADAALLRQLGLELVTPDAGCCGLAGSFGYEKGEKYEVSVKAGERVLAPAIREAGEDTLIVADGFSCRSQIAHLTRRRALHLAEVLHMALRQDQLPDERRPEDAYLGSLERPPERRAAGVGAALLGLSLVAAGAVAAGLVRSRRHGSA